MDLKNFLSGTKEKQEHYWALVIEPAWVQAGVWKIDGEKADVVSLSPASPWETAEELINAVDTSLSAAVQNLPEDIEEPTKTVFGLSVLWVENGQIKKEYLEIIKNICTSLSLEPAGFVVLPEAIAHFIKSKEGSPLNAVVLGMGKDNLEIAVFRLGNLVGTSSVAKSVSIVEDVIEGLSRFHSSEPLPSRILLYDGRAGELEDIKQNLLTAQWDENEKIKFLHTPNVEIIESDEKILATALAGGSEISSVSSVVSEKENEKFTEEEKISEEVENIKSPTEEVTPEDLGFLVGQDIANKEIQEAKVPQNQFVPQPQNIPSEIFPQQPINKPFSLGIFKSLKDKITLPKFSGAGNKKKLIILGVITLVLLAGILAFLWYYPKAIVTVYVSPKRLEEKISLSVNTQLTNSEFSNLVLAGQIYQTEVTGEKTKSTSGIKTVGEKAKGSVKIQNGTDQIIKLPVGTSLLSGNNLKYVTLSTASVSAALSPSSPGETTIEAAAFDIGAQFNIVKEEILKVGNYPKADVDAIVVADFSGGSSRQISAVSSEDQKTLEEDLKTELLEKAKDELKSKITNDQLFIDSSIMATASSKTFSAKVGDEATNLKLNLDLSVSGVSVKDADVYNLAKDFLKDKLPSGFVLRQDQISLRFDQNKVKDKIYDFSTALSVNLLPEVNPDEIAKKIAGKKPILAEKYFNTIPGFINAEIKFRPEFFKKIALPMVARNIIVEVSAER